MKNPQESKESETRYIEMYGVLERFYRAILGNNVLRFFTILKEAVEVI